MMGKYKDHNRYQVDLPKMDPYYESFLKTALNIQPKLIITGTLGLKLCGLFEDREIGDLDFNLSEPLTEDEVLVFKDFFESFWQRAFVFFQCKDNIISYCKGIHFHCVYVCSVFSLLF